MYQLRIQKVREKIKTNKIDGFLISNFFSIFYLSGIKTLTPEEREAFLFITQKNVYFFTDGRYESDELLKNIESFEGVFKRIEIGKKLTDHLAEIISQELIQSIAFEEEDLKYVEFLMLEKMGIKLVPEKNIVPEIREIKSKEELTLIKKACELSDQCLKELLPVIKVGLSEKELAWKMECWMRDHGYELAFDPIVAVDANSSIPHYDTKTGNGIIKNGSVLLLDYGVRFKHYNSDISRMVFIGKQKDEIIKTYHSLLEAQDKTIQFVQKGKNLREIDLFCRNELKKNNLPDFAHSTGHGVGLEVHENPKVSFRSEDSLKKSQVFTIEPGVYKQGNYGMRIEDTVFVNDSFQAIQLTHFPKSFLQL